MYKDRNRQLSYLKRWRKKHPTYQRDWLRNGCVSPLKKNDLLLSRPVVEEVSTGR